ncbi:sodium-dependent proline transporter isoform X1 [Patella vulgata]|uniref:sodium-dependent proline transporter isoform X1 n=2 Tax=Patella vulgata TaxID=6465 RepID=UPI0024A8A59F|nr:sodium-dependent proline transporter isoform X1 [Patella vulgata]XP_055959003.1 sodium-dependent proline transporter isoform X1 [Patella vulgata]XP_055959004.1 sodium-dependent proline transporter isoform X1 [Patella vulgata]
MAEEKKEVVPEGTEEPERGNWGGKLDFFMSCVGYAVGLGNIWRFPYLCFRNGGGAFLIPYTIMLVIAGLPLFFFELSFGQFASLGPLAVWRVNPLFWGVGLGMISISAMVCIYYNVVITYAMFYLMVSIINLDGQLPWTTCDNLWNSPYCLSTAIPSFKNMSEDQKLNVTLGMFNETCLEDGLQESGISMDDLTFNLTQTNFSDCNLKHLYKLPSEEYFTRFVLQLHEAKDFSDVGGISVKLAFVLALAWILLFFCLKKGVKTSGKVVYFMATFPYVILICLLVRGVTLEGSMEGIKFYIIPEWERLLDIDVWRQAATQIFYSLGPAFGSLITMASFNPFKHNSHRDAIIVSMINCGTSVFAGFIIFSVLGFMAHTTNQEVKDVAVDGPGLVFVVYPLGISHMPGAAIWSFLFFFMLVALGLDSQFAMFEAIISAIIDTFPHFLRPRRTKFAMFCHFIGFLLGLPLVTKGGIWVLTLMEWYSASFGLMIVCLTEIVAVIWIYGIKNFSNDVEIMLGFQPALFWKATWVVITPVAISLMLILSAVKSSPASYGSYKFESWVQDVGWAMVAIPIVLIILPMPFQIRRYGSLRNATRPTPEWGPANPKDRVGRYARTELQMTSIAQSNGSVVEVDSLKEGRENSAYVSEKL